MSDIGIGSSGGLGGLDRAARASDTDRTSGRPDDSRLYKAAKELEGVFVEQLFKAMRETVPEGGLTDGGSGEEIFTSLLDQHLANLAPQQWDSGPGAALYRQLRNAVDRAADPSSVQE